MTDKLVYTPQHIANFFLDKADGDNVPLTQLKLIKLIYIAYGWVLATLDRRLFDEPIQAWKHGPVIPSIYHEFKHFKNEPIIGFRAVNFDLDEKTETEPRIDKKDEANRVLDRVWDAYKHASAAGLVSLTHREGTPWYKHYKPNKYDTHIPDEDIKAHFIEKLTEYVNAAAA